MPYTTTELESVDFFQDFISELRDKYLSNMKSLANVDFKKNGVLYSFEDIFTGLGIEDVNIEGIYKFLYQLDYSKYTAEQILEAKNNPDITLQPETKDKRNKQLTVHTEKQKRYIKTQNLEKIINRNISELSDATYATTLPTGVVNGSIVTNESSVDYTKWRISNNQKRVYPDSATFYGEADSYTSIVTLTSAQLNSIPDGEPVDVWVD